MWHSANSRPNRRRTLHAFDFESQGGETRAAAVMSVARSRMAAMSSNRVFMVARRAAPSLRTWATSPGSRGGTRGGGVPALWSMWASMTTSSHALSVAW